MTEEQLEKLYRIVRVAIFSIPAIVIVVGFYLVLFPIDSYKFYPDDPKLSKFEITKDAEKNRLSFGVFPLRSYRYIELSMNVKKSEKENCASASPEITLTKTYRSFLLPTGDLVSTEDRLHSLLFDGNKTRYPNGSLLHLRPTNEVFLISRGKKILFPGPEVLQAFGYSFDNLVEVEQSDIDQFPDADQKVFLWTMTHPDGTIFQAYPSHSLYLIFEGEKHLIGNEELLSKVWPENFTIPVSDLNPEDTLKCAAKIESNQMACQFDSSKLSSIGRYFYFSVNFPENCLIGDVHPGYSQLRFFSERSLLTVKESLRSIAASALNRYFYKQY